MQKRFLMKTLGTVLAASIVLTSVPVTTKAGEAANTTAEAIDSTGTGYIVGVTSIKNSNCYWSITEDGTLEITGNGDPGIYISGYQGVFSLPWGHHLSDIKAVTIGENVKPTNMDYWFYSCSNLVTAPVIPESVESCHFTFYGCSNLQGDLFVHGNVARYGNMLDSAVSEPNKLNLYHNKKCTKELAENIAAENVNVNVAEYCTAKKLECGNIRVGASNTGRLSYSGNLPGTPIYKSSNEKVLKINDYHAPMYTNYTGIAYGTATITATILYPDGTSSGVSCDVTVTNVAPSITKQPEDITAEPGQAASFTVKADGSNNTYQWYIANDKISTGTELKGATESTYTISADSVTPDLNGKYFYCVVSNEGNDPVTSDKVKLSVVTIPNAPTFSANVSSDSWANKAVTIGLLGSEINGSTEFVAYKYSLNGGVTWLDYADPFVWNTDTTGSTIMAKAYNTKYNTSVSDVAKFIIKYDATAPVIKAVNVEDKTVSITAADATSGVEGYALLENKNDTPEWKDSSVIIAEDYGTYYAAVKDNAGNVTIASETVNLAKNTGNCNVTMKDWKYGETPAEPEYSSTTHDISKAVITYAVKGSEEYTSEKPSVPGTYTVKVTLPETDEYQEISAKCDFTIEKADLEVVTENYAGDYDGKAHSAAVTCDGADIKYGMEKGTYDLDTMPQFTDAGSYTVYYEVSKENYNTVTGSVTVTIAQISGSVKVSITDWNYGETPSEPVIKSDTYDVKNAVITYSIKDEDEYGSEKPSVPGEYVMKVFFPETDNMESAEITYDFAIHKGTLDVASEDYTGIYDGKPHVAVVSCDGADIRYGIKKGTYDFTSMPQYTNAGSYTVYYEVSKENYNTETGSVTVIIDKASEAPDKPESVVNVPYTTKTVGDVALGDGIAWKWEIPSVELAVGVPYTAVAVYTGEDAANYEVVKANVVITRAACKHPDEFVQKKAEKAATCTENGHTESAVCTQCNEVLVAEQQIEAKGHDWDNGIVTKEATETETGIKTYTCKNCRATKTEDIPLKEAEVKDEDESVLTNTVVTEKETITVWVRKDGTERIVYSAPADKNVTSADIPDEVEINGQMVAVNEIANSAFNGCKNLKTVSIGKNVRVIGNNAFKNCKALTTVKMENNVETIGYSSFMNCKKLKSIVIPETVKEINDGAFRNCKKLATVKMKTKQLKIIDDNVFYGCKALKSIVIPEEVTEIGDNAFKGCQSLKKVSMATCKLSLIGDNAFNGCKKLTSFDIPDAVKRIGDRAFYNCKSLKNIMIASTKLSSKRVGSEAFKGINKKATVKVSPKKMKSYRKLLKAKGLSKTAKVSKWMPAASAKHKM